MKKKPKKLLMWGIFAVIFSATLIAEYFIEIHPVSVIDGKRFFYAWFSFSVCIFMVLFTKVLGLLLKRRESYYKEHSEGRR